VNNIPPQKQKNAAISPIPSLGKKKVFSKARKKAKKWRLMKKYVEWVDLWA